MDNKVTLIRAYTDEIFELTAPWDNIYQGAQTRMLFVCSAGLLRSPTAAKVAAQMGYNSRSCGSHSYALIPLSVNLLTWAQKIYFLNEENYHESLDVFKFDPESIKLLKDKSIVWDIDDQFNYDDFTLKEEVKKLLS